MFVGVVNPVDHDVNVDEIDWDCGIAAGVVREDGFDFKFPFTLGGSDIGHGVGWAFGAGADFVFRAVAFEYNWNIRGDSARDGFFDLSESFESFFLAAIVEVAAVESVNGIAAFEAAFARDAHFTLEFVEVKKFDDGARADDDLVTISAIGMNVGKRLKENTIIQVASCRD